jgi:uncharacterized protein (DUF433 family)
MPEEIPRIVAEDAIQLLGVASHAPAHSHRPTSSVVRTRIVGRLAARNRLWHFDVGMNLELLQRITIEEGKCGGRPCIRGKRIRVTDILELLSAGASFEEILEDYPFLERDDILAAIGYAARQTDHVVLRAS